MQQPAVNRPSDIGREGVTPTQITTLNSLVSSDYEGEAFVIIEEHAYADEVVTVGDGQWADEEMYAFVKPRPAAQHVLDLIEDGHLDRTLMGADEMESVSLSVSPTYISEHTCTTMDEFVTVTLYRDDGYQVDLSFEAQAMIDKSVKEGLMSFDGKLPSRGRSL